ncbi:SNF2 family N-terminal domain-containing protein [Haematococcus lacustris]
MPRLLTSPPASSRWCCGRPPCRPPPPHPPAVPPPSSGAALQGEVRVDAQLVRWLRPHQREGLAFMFDCVMGLRLAGGRGCILADDMGLGKTLQGLALLWTLLTAPAHPDLMAAGLGPIARRALIVCPTSLVSNWDSEARKWLGGRLATLALCKASKEEVVEGIQHFLHPSNPYKVLIVSYETFRLHGDRFNQPGSCDLLICDEAHRLKNDATLTNRALGSLPCKRRVLLSGTPMQNHLDEFYAMVDFANPGVLGTPTEFRRSYEVPILAAREPGASPEAAALGAERSLALSTLVNAFILRRTNSLLSAHLPPKVVQVVCCKLMPLQHAIYCHFLESKAARKILGGRGTSGVLPAISNLKKLCNHPKLIYDAVHRLNAGRVRGCTCRGVAALFPPCLFDDGRPGRGGCAPGWETTSGKFAVATRMLALLWAETQDRIVIVSNYTQTLDLFGQLCRERGWPFLRLDGSTSIEKREKLVQAFCDPSQNQFVFLLSSKAGGCGLNLVGGNRLLLYDCDWNPAVDKQAAARVWRDGQQKRVFVYRFLATGTIEEKVFQRQISKEGLQALVANANEAQVAGDTTGV